MWWATGSRVQKGKPESFKPQCTERGWGLPQGRNTNWQSARTDTPWSVRSAAEPGFATAVCLSFFPSFFFTYLIRLVLLRNQKHVLTKSKLLCPPNTQWAASLHCWHSVWHLCCCLTVYKNIRPVSHLATFCSGSQGHKCPCRWEDGRHSRAVSIGVSSGVQPLDCQCNPTGKYRVMWVTESVWKTSRHLLQGKTSADSV